MVQIMAGGRTMATSMFISSLSGAQKGKDLQTYHSPNHYMIVKFSSDKSSQKGGFKADWKSGEI